jgi:hypothetical protein
MVFTGAAGINTVRTTAADIMAVDITELLTILVPATGETTSVARVMSVDQVLRMIGDPIAGET